MITILYERGDYWVCRPTNGKKWYEVYKNTGTVATRCATIGLDGEEGMRKAIAEINRRTEKDATAKK